MKNIKKIIGITLVLMFGASVNVFAGDASVYVDGIELPFSNEKAYFDEYNKLQLPINKIDEAFWCDVDYGGSDHTYTLTKGETVVKFQIRDDKYYIGEEVRTLEQPLVDGYFPVKEIAGLFGAEIKTNGNRVDVVGPVYAMKADFDIASIDKDDIKNISAYAYKYPSYYLDGKLRTYKGILGSASTEKEAKQVVLDRFEEINVKPTSCELIAETDKYYCYEFNWNVYPEGETVPIKYSANMIVTKNTFYDFPNKTFTALNRNDVSELINLMFHVEICDNNDITIVKSNLSYDNENYYQTIYYIERNFDDGKNPSVYNQSNHIAFKMRVYSINIESGLVESVKESVVSEVIKLL